MNAFSSMPLSARWTFGVFKMHEVTIFDDQGKRVVIDFDKLLLDDGTRARDYQEPADLFRKLKAMKVDGIAVDQGTYQLLIALGRHRAATVAPPPVHKRQPEVGDRP
jgi:hypothetical protein